MPIRSNADTPSRKNNTLGTLLDKVIHPTRGSGPTESDPGRPFTPPVSQPSKDERDDDEDGPNFPMDPALA